MDQPALQFPRVGAVKDLAKFVFGEFAKFVVGEFGLNGAPNILSKQIMANTTMYCHSSLLLCILKKTCFFLVRNKICPMDSNGASQALSSNAGVIH